MSLSRPVQPSLGRPSGDEHWTRKLKKENVKLLGQVELLQKILTDNKITIPTTSASSRVVVEMVEMVIEMVMTEMDNHPVETMRMMMTMTVQMERVEWTPSLKSL